MNPLRMLAHLIEVEGLTSDDANWLVMFQVNNVIVFTDVEVKELKLLYERYIGYGYER